MRFFSICQLAAIAFLPLPLGTFFNFFRYSKRLLVTCLRMSVIDLALIIYGGESTAIDYI